MNMKNNDYEKQGMKRTLNQQPNESPKQGL